MSPSHQKTGEYPWLVSAVGTRLSGLVLLAALLLVATDFGRGVTGNALSMEVKNSHCLDTYPTEIADMDAIQLRSLAQICGPGKMQSLYLNRAVASELMQSYRQYRKLDSIRYGQDDRESFDTYRMTIALMEAFAAHRIPANEYQEALLDELNRSYEVLNDVAEMRLKGVSLASVTGSGV